MKEDKFLSNPEVDPPTEDETLLAVPDPHEQLLADFIDTQDSAKIDSMIPVFNSFFKKRDILQKHAEYDLKDKLLERMTERLDKTPDNFNNSDLASWMKIVQQAIDSSKESDQQSAAPAITYQQNNNVHVSIADTLSRDSRARITDAIQKILQNVQNEEVGGVCLNESPEEEGLESNLPKDSSEASEDNNNEKPME